MWGSGRVLAWASKWGLFTILCFYAKLVFMLFTFELWYRAGVPISYPGRKFSDAVEHVSIALVSKQKIGGTFYIRKLARVNGRKNAENPCYRGLKQYFVWLGKLKLQNGINKPCVH